MVCRGNYLVLALTALTAKLLATCSCTGCRSDNSLGRISMLYLFIDLITSKALIPVMSFIVLRNVVNVSDMSERLLYYVLTFSTNLSLGFGCGINVGSMSSLTSLYSTSICTCVPVTVCVRHPSGCVIVTKHRVLVYLGVCLVTSVAFRGFGTVVGTGCITIGNVICEGVSLLRAYVRLCVSCIASVTLSGLGALCHTSCISVGLVACE